MAPEWIQMVHPDIEGENVEPATVTRDAFESVWQDKGWEEYTEDQPATAVQRRPTQTVNTGSES